MPKGTLKVWKAKGPLKLPMEPEGLGKDTVGKAGDQCWEIKIDNPKREGR